MNRPTLLLACLVVACSADPIAATELGEVCGQSGPFRVLPLEPDQQLYFNRPLTVGDRVLYVVSERGEDEPGAKAPTITDTTVYATGPCGESPVEVARGVDFLVAPEVWPGVVLGCHMKSGDVVVLDPSGADAPRVLFTGVGSNGFGCGLDWTPHGVLALEPRGEQQGALVLHRYPAGPDDDAASPSVLLDPIRVADLTAPAFQGTHASLVRSFDEFALAITTKDELVRVELVDGAVSTFSEHVAAIEASSDGDDVLWQGATRTTDDPQFPEGKIFVRESSDGLDTLLAEGSLAYNYSNALRHIDDGVIVLRFKSPAAGTTQRAYFLPALDFVDVPANMFLSTALDDGRWLAQSILPFSWGTIDLRTGESTPLLARQARGVYVNDDELLLIEGNGDSRKEGAVWRATFDGAATVQLPGRATWQAAGLARGRVITPRSLDADWLGPLVLLDAETDSETQIDDDVFAFSLDTSRAHQERIVRYSVSDGARSGVYLAKLP